MEGPRRNATRLTADSPTKSSAEGPFSVGWLHHIDEHGDDIGVRQRGNVAAKSTRSALRYATVNHAHPNWSASPAEIFRRMRLMILPERVLGRFGTI